MEHYNGTVARIFLHVSEHFFRRLAARIIASDKVVHYNVVVILDGSGLTPAHEAVRRAEERAVDQGVGHSDVAHVLPAAGVHALKVVHGVVAEAVTTPPDLIKQLRVPPDIVAHHEEGGLDVVLVKYVKHPRRDLWNGAVIEGEIDHLAVAVLDAPSGLGEKEAIEQGRLFYEHGQRVLWLNLFPAAFRKTDGTAPAAGGKPADGQD